LDSDKRKLILNFFLSNEIINLVHDTLFLGKNGGNNQLEINDKKTNFFGSSNVSSRMTSGKNISESSKVLGKNTNLNQYKYNDNMIKKNENFNDNSKFNNTFNNNKGNLNPYSTNNFPGSKNNTLFHKTSYPKKDDKLISEYKSKKVHPTGLSMNITGRIKNSNNFI
jgi:hypothetical protein